MKEITYPNAPHDPGLEQEPRGATFPLPHPLAQSTPEGRVPFSGRGQTATTRIKALAPVSETRLPKAAAVEGTAQARLP